MAGKRRKQAKSRRTSGEKLLGAEREAMLMLAEGHSATAVGRHYGVARETVRDWRDKPENQKLLEEARRAREAEFREAQQSVRRIYREASIKAALRMVDLLDDPDQAATAARDILDRIGVLRGEQITLGTAGPDLSTLSESELSAYLELMRKVTKR